MDYDEKRHTKMSTSTALWYVFQNHPKTFVTGNSSDGYRIVIEVDGWYNTEEVALDIAKVVFAPAVEHLQRVVSDNSFLSVAAAKELDQYDER